MECILKCGKPCTENDKIGEQRWGNLKTHSKKWEGVDPYGDIYITTKWDTDRESHYCHKSCFAKIGEVKRLQGRIKILEQKKRKEEELLKKSGKSTIST